ncbi:MAG: hypothetical protein JWM87_4871 [Candidatus Eremiobacteraeota bacterium]|nr:hypothetical protein [Candidatus Eremiobacteraeota bacterium]
MHVTSPSTFALAALAAVLGAQIPASAADVPVTSITLAATRAAGAEAVRITGKAPASQPLEATLYATFSKDLPAVLLSRRPVSTDADGRFDAALPIAPAYFRNAVVTIVVRSLTAGAGARTAITIAAPNLPAPPDDIPASVR